jgi:hypothetical protein
MSTKKSFRPLADSISLFFFEKHVVIACMGILKSRADFYGSASLAACERSWSAWIRNVSEGNSPGGTVHRAAYLYSVGSWNPNHDAIIRIGGEVPG